MLDAYLEASSLRELRSYCLIISLFNSLFVHQNFPGNFSSSNFSVLHIMFITHKGTKTLDTVRLILRRFQSSDDQAMFKYASDKETTRFMRFPVHKSIEDSREIIRQWSEEYRNMNFYSWAIVCRECNEVIGSIAINDVNEFHRQGEVGYIIRKDHWGKGLMTEALCRVIRFCFDELNFQRLESLHSVENPASGRVMVKAGMVNEGTKRNYFPTDHGYMDCPMYAITREDYETAYSK